MSYLEYNIKSVPTGIRKLLYINWPIVILLVAIACTGFLMLYSVAGGSTEPWMNAQMKRFGVGMAVLFIVAMVPIWFWRNVSAVAYAGSLVLLLLVEYIGDVQMAPSAGLIWALSDCSRPS
jgi:rod shape determining protein RodA